MSKRSREPGEVEPLVPNDEEEPPTKKAKVERMVLVKQTGVSWCVTIEAHVLLEIDDDADMCAWFDSTIDREHEDQWTLTLPSGTCDEMRTMLAVFVKLLPHYTYLVKKPKESIPATVQGLSPFRLRSIAMVLAYCNCTKMLAVYEQAVMGTLAFKQSTGRFIRRHLRCDCEGECVKHALSLDDAYEWARRTNNVVLMRAVAKAFALDPSRLQVTNDVRKDLWPYVIELAASKVGRVDHNPSEEKDIIRFID